MGKEDPKQEYDPTYIKVMNLKIPFRITYINDKTKQGNDYKNYGYSKRKRRFYNQEHTEDDFWDTVNVHLLVGIGDSCTVKLDSSVLLIFLMYKEKKFKRSSLMIECYESDFLSLLFES